jgi:hypothetical protein
MIVISTAAVLAASPSDPLNTPIFGWRTLVTAANVSADTAAAGLPASNLANPSTALEWRGATATAQNVTADIQSADPVDYVGIARHNFGSARIGVKIQGSVSPGVWFDLTSDFMPDDDAPLLFRFVPQALVSVRAVLAAGTAPPRAAVLYAGKLLVCERGLTGDHTPINLGRTTNVLTNRSESGNFLGRVIVGQTRGTSATFQRVPADWYRAHMDPFVVAAKELPFFFAWKPQALPRDIGYCWLTRDPQPVLHFDTGTVSVTFDLAGVA